jgi:hypothetical protein
MKLLDDALQGWGGEQEVSAVGNGRRIHLAGV